MLTTIATLLILIYCRKKSRNFKTFPIIFLKKNDRLYHEETELFLMYEYKCKLELNLTREVV